MVIMTAIGVVLGLYATWKVIELNLAILDLIKKKGTVTPNNYTVIDQQLVSAPDLISTGAVQTLRQPVSDLGCLIMLENPTYQEVSTDGNMSMLNYKEYTRVIQSPIGVISSKEDYDMFYGVELTQQTKLTPDVTTISEQPTINLPASIICTPPLCLTPITPMEEGRHMALNWKLITAILAAGIDVHLEEEVHG